MSTLSEVIDRTRARRFVERALTVGAMRIEPTCLKSGRKSPYFFNAGLFSRGQDLYALAESYANCCADVDHGTVIFGSAYKGIPIAVSTALALGQVYGLDVGYAFNRKEVKDHGEGGEIVGANMKGRPVVLVDDVMTTGRSFEEAMTIVSLLGGTPIRCVIAFDRQEREIDGLKGAVQAFVSRYRIPVRAVSTLNDLIEVVRIDAGHRFPHAYASLPEIVAYRNEYGVIPV